jgi:sulfatase maturation enzyme AslB (radical SAM superfamily)
MGRHELLAVPPPLQLGRKTNPLPFLLSGWHANGDTAIWQWATQKNTSIAFSSHTAEDLYFMGEISALSPAQAENPQNITLSINGTFVDTWVIDSPTVHDKLIQIPAHLTQRDKPTTIQLTLQASEDPPPSAGVRLHSIALHANLDSYLDELQIGYNWVCSIRDELIDMIRRVLFFFDNIAPVPSEITMPLQTILNDPNIITQNEAALSFDETYFQRNRHHLKEGHIHQAIRQWATELKELRTDIINAGNYATRQPDNRCWRQEGLNELLTPPLQFTDKIATLRERNTTLNNLEIILHKDKLDSTPPILYLDITNQCNFRCRMCYQSKSHFLRQNLINSHLAIIINKLPYFSEITIAGLGEPLLSKNLLPLAERAKALRCHTTIITNGSLIAGNISILKQFSTVSISFDGSEATTFEALRHRSKFDQIVNNIRRLRHEAPDIVIAFSVVVSRANLDELAKIVQMAANLGVNLVNITPLEHMPVFELKKSDLPCFHDQITEANQIATRTGIILTIAVSPQNFSDTDDTPLNKNSLIDQLSSMEPMPEEHTKPEAIALLLQTAKFNYYPDPIVFIRPNRPALESNRGYIQSSTFDGYYFDIDKELSFLDNKIKDRLIEIQKYPQQLSRIPYCLAPWKFNYIKHNGTNRLCCHTDFVVGDTGSNGFFKANNSQKYQQTRQGMIGRHTMLPACRACKAVDRALGLKSIIDTGKKYGIHIDANHLPSTTK